MITLAKEIQEKIALVGGGENQFVPNNEIIINKINAMIYEYNSKLDLLKENKNTEKYNLSVDTFESVTQNL